MIASGEQLLLKVQYNNIIKFESEIYKGLFLTPFPQSFLKFKKDDNFYISLIIVKYYKVNIHKVTFVKQKPSSN